MHNIQRFQDDLLFGENISIEQRNAGRKFDYHWHSFYEIMYYKNCQGKCLLNGTAFELEDHCLFFLTPKDFHKTETYAQEGAVYINISFNEQMLDSRLVNKLSSSPFVLKNLPVHMINTIDHSLEIYQGTSDFRDMQLKYLLNSLVIDILNKADCVESSTSFINPAISDTVFRMVSNPGVQYSLEETAAKYGMNPSYFSRLFHSTTGISFKKYNNQLRIELAKRLLEENNMSILEVSLECGFNTPSNFIRIFKDIVGIVPSEYGAAYKS